MSRALIGGLLLLAGAVCAAPAAADETPAPANLQALLDEAQKASPALAAAADRAQAAAHVAPQAASKPDPIASIRLINESLTHLTLGESPDSVLEFRWTQDVPYPGKLDLAAAAARADTEAAGLQAEQLRWELGAAVKKDWTELVRLQRTLDILGGSRELLQSFQQAARVRYESGEGMLESVLKAQTELAKLEADQVTLVQRQREVELDLMALLGREEPVVLVADKAWPEVVAAPDEQALIDHAVAHAPGLLQVAQAQQAASARADLARRNLKADFSWEAAYGNRGGLDPMYSAMAGFRLPIRKNSRQAEAIAQADLSVQAALRDADARKVELLRGIRAAWSRQQRATDLAGLYRDAILPQARASRDAASASYRAGKTDFLTLLDSFMTMLRYEIDLEARTAERISTFADLEPLTAMTLVQPGGGHE